MTLKRLYSLIIAFVFLFLLFNCVGIKADEIDWKDDFTTIYTNEEQEGISIQLFNDAYAIVTNYTESNLYTYEIINDKDHVIKVLIAEDTYAYFKLLQDAKFEYASEKEIIEYNIDEIGDEIKNAIKWVVSILASLGITWASILAVINWIKKKLKKGNKDIEQATTALDGAKDELKDTKETIKNLINDMKELQNKVVFLANIIEENFNAQKGKEEELNKQIKEILYEEKA